MPRCVTTPSPQPALNPRTTQLLVSGIITVRGNDDLTPFINAANGLVTQCCTNLIPTAVIYTDAWLQLIETWLSAHLYSILRPGKFLQQVETIREQIESKVGLGLDVTRYGQQAKRLDFNGGLAALDNSLGKVIKRLPGSGVVVGVQYIGGKRRRDLRGPDPFEIIEDGGVDIDVDGNP